MPVSLSRRSVLIGGGAVLAVALAVMLTVVLRGGDPAPAPLAAPAYTADPVPKMPALRTEDLPKRCGVRAATIRKYAPGDDDPDHGGTSCHWYSLNQGTKHCAFCPANDGDRERVLDVSITTGDESRVKSDSAAGDALRTLDPADSWLVTGRSSGRAMGGLGDEAVYRYSPALDAQSYAATGGSLKFRVGATVVSVTYDGRDFAEDGPLRQVPEKEAEPAVLAVGADVARSLHTAAKPAPAQPRAGGPAPIRTMPRPCDLLPRGVVDRLADGAVRSRGEPGVTSSGIPGTPYGLAVDACEWESTPTCCLGEDTDHRPERHLSVTVQSIAEWRRGIAVPEATRRYLESHYDARDTGTGTAFHALRGLGEQAYAAYRDDPSMSSDEPAGEVVFRHRNVVVQVTYRGGDDAPISRDAAITGAYTAALHARAALPA